MVTLLGLMMRKGLVYCIACCGLLLSSPLYSWNAVGHRLIAQIAYDQLTPQAKRKFNHYNRVLNKFYPAQNWTGAAVWLDTIRYQHNSTYNAMHFINYSFSDDGSPLLPISETNAITAITQSVETLKAPRASEYDKGIALRILLHVVGDIHQPLHATSRVSSSYPDGDRGGHFVTLSKNSVAKNLHAYWDNGGGYLKMKHTKKRQPSLKSKIKQLENEYPCHTLVQETTTPTQWAQESHELGVRAYQFLYQNRADHRYQDETVKVVKKRIALAGCRLGFLLNHLV
jgi:hypothetical protein